ncbi:hypothetical protein ACHAXS_001096 [Conticribra weissflogii]
MTTKAHAILSLLLCQATCLLVYKKSPQLIGFIHGPSAEIFAIDRNAALRSLLTTSTYMEIMNDGGDCEDIYQAAYGDGDGDDRDGAAIVRDAGAICAIFAILVGLVPKSTSKKYSVLQRIQFLLLALPIYVTASFLGQVIVRKSTPIEVLLAETWGVRDGFLLGGYCSILSLLGDGFDVTGETIRTIILHEMKVVVIAVLFAFSFLGIVPLEASH